MKILGIETSCDETAAAVVADDSRILANVVSSQIELHRLYRGIVPELASRAHLRKIAPVVEEALHDAGLSRPDAVAYTRGPGLLGPLLVGKVAAQTLAYLWDCPLVGVHHLEGHLFAAELGGEAKLRFPILALIVSGGHTDLILAKKPGLYRVLGRTRDDAAGEAFDKAARMLDLGYPGGPAIDLLAKTGNPQAVSFPRALMPQTWDFSFSGLKTSLLYRLEREGKPRGDRERSDIAASFQEAIVDALIEKTLAAARRFKIENVVVGGGVAANSRLRRKIKAAAGRQGLNLSIPPPGLCTDNGAMIAQAAIYRLGSGRISKTFRPDPSLPFQNWGQALTF